MNGQAFNSSRRMEFPNKCSKMVRTRVTHITPITVPMAAVVVVAATASPTRKIIWGSLVKVVINTIPTRSKTTGPTTTCGSACSIIQSDMLLLASSPTLNNASFLLFPHRHFIHSL